ncbi:MAG: hypothetical protein IKH75_11665 [Ruminococcus sp.]|nr:hypothetical protein [Ruminococcus sp.]
MAFVKKTWVDRVVQYPNRRNINDGYTTKTVTVSRNEGNVTVEGTPLNADTFNDLENRILAAFGGGGGGGGGFSGDYEDLYNRPQINGVTLSGNKATSDLHISYNDLEDLPVIPVMSAIFNAVYPVGTIYTSVSNANPGTIFGGTWVAFGSGKTLVGVDTSDTDFNTVQKTGGEKKHQLTIDEMPRHNHDKLKLRWNTATGANAVYGSNGSGTGEAYDEQAYEGGDQPHNIVQPYITVYFWKRVS